MASEENRKNTVPENVADKPAPTVSEHTTNHKQNSKKSKQPARRNAKSTFQPGQHGRLVPFIMYDGEGKAVKGLANLFNSLANRFNDDDVVNTLLIELAVTDYWRLSQAVQIEASRPGSIGFYPQLTQYLTVSRRNLDRSLQMLLQLDKETAEAEASEAETEEAEKAETETATDAASPSQPAPTPETSEEPSTPAASTTSANEAAAAEPQPTAVESTAVEAAAETLAVEGAGKKPATDLPAAA